MSTILCCLFAIASVGQTKLSSEESLTYLLHERVDVGTQVQTKLLLQICGTITTGGKQESMAGQALLEYPERVLEIGADGLASRMVRYYSDARAKFIVAENEDSRQLRPGYRIMVGEHTGESLELWTPGGPLTSSECELIEDVLDPTRLPGLLPSSAVGVGQSWQPDDLVIGALCNLENCSECEVLCTLVELAGEKALVSVAGSVQGLSAGAEIEIEIEAKLRFDLAEQMITEVNWRQSDTRSPSPVGPAGSYVIKITIQRQNTSADRLSNESLALVDLKSNPKSKLIVFEDLLNRFRFYHDRNWHVTLTRADRAVLRRLEDNEFIAQLDIAISKNHKGDKKFSVQEFRKMIEREEDVIAERIVHSAEIVTDGSLDLQFLSTRAQNDDIRMVRKHYLATARDLQVLFSFTMDPEDSERMGINDLMTVSTLEVLDRIAGRRDGVERK